MTVGVYAERCGSRDCGGADRCRTCKGLVREVYPRFPIQSGHYGKKSEGPHPVSVSWRLAELAYPAYENSGGRGQSLERLAERGGFGWTEFSIFLAGHVGFDVFEDVVLVAAARLAALEATEKDAVELAVAQERREIVELLRGKIDALGLGVIREVDLREIAAMVELRG